MVEKKQKSESIGDRVKRSREQLGWGTPKLAAKVGLKSQTIQDLENGKSRGTKHILRLAEALMQSPQWLESGEGQMRRHFDLTALSDAQRRARSAPDRAAITLAPGMKVEMRQVPVIGCVQAGVWLSTVELPPEDRFDIPLPVQSGFDGFVVQGLIVRGPSMDEIYPHGSILAVVNFMELGRDPRNGERVVALRSRHGETEATVKEFRVGRDGKARLWPRSSHPDFQQPVAVDGPRDDGDELHIAYLVIGSYRPEA